MPGETEMRLSSRDASAKIWILDEAEPVAGMIEHYRDACLDHYRPGAEARSMALEAVWLSPPLILDCGANSLYFLWSFSDLGAFWRARFADTEAKAAWWSATAHMVRERRRSILTDFSTRP